MKGTVISRVLCILVIFMLGSSSMMGILFQPSFDGFFTSDANTADASSDLVDISPILDHSSDYLWNDDKDEIVDFRGMLESYRENADTITYFRTSQYSEEQVGFGFTFEVHDTTLTIHAIVNDYGIANYQFVEGYYQALMISGLQLSTHYGMPALPYEKLMFNVPFGAEVIDVSVLSKSSETLFGLNVVPGPKPVAIYGDEKPDATLFFDPSAYSSTSFLPTQIVESEIVQKGSERALMLTINPLQYKPILKQGLLHDEVVIDIRFSSPVTVKDVTFSGWIDYHGSNYTIITTEELTPVLVDFIDWKSTLGFNVQVATINEILSSYPGRDSPEKVRSFISAAYSENQTEYFLLVGDCDIVPVREVVDPAGGPGLDNGTEPSDLYYECLDGTWDDNGNDMFGELDDEVDLFPEVKVGRLPVQTPSEAQTVLKHIISYESNPEPGDWLNDFMLIAVDCFGSGDGVVMSEGQLNQKFLFDSFFDVFRYYPTDLSLSTSNVVSKINSGVNIVNFFDHGAYDVWVDALTVDDVLALSNGNKSIFAFAMACETAAFDVEEVEPTIGEAFFRNADGGASTYIGATRVAWAGYDCFDGFHNMFWEFFLTEALSSYAARPKDAFHAALNYMATTYDTTNAPTLESIYQAIYFGDPSLSLYWKHNVTTFTAPVEVNEEVTLNGTCLMYNNRPIIDTVVVTAKDPLGNEVYSNMVSTDSLGRYSVKFNTSSYPGNYTVETHITQPFEHTALTKFSVGLLGITLELDSEPTYNTYLDFSGTVGDDCDGIAILLDSLGSIISNISLSSIGGIFSQSINLTSFGWLSLYIRFDNGAVTGGTDVSFKVIRGEVLIIADNAGSNYGPEYPGGWADSNRGDASNPGDYVIALKNEYEVSMYFTMYQSTPSISLLNSYDLVIVTTGDNYGYPLVAPDSYLLDVLYTYHLSGKPLLIEGASILSTLESLGNNTLSSLFHVEYIESTINSGSLELVKSLHPLMSGLPASILLEDQLGSKVADVFAPTNGSLQAAEYGGSYTGGTAISGLPPTAGLGGVVFIGFSIDAIVNSNHRNTLIQNAASFLLHPSLMVTMSDNALQTGTSETIYFEVTDSATEAPVEGALVSLSGCGVSSVNTTLSDGTCSLIISPSGAGIIQVNATKGDFLNFTTEIIVYDYSIVALTATPAYLERGETRTVTFTTIDFYERFPLENCFVNATGLGNSVSGFTNESGMVDLVLTASAGGMILVLGRMANYVNATIYVPVRLTAVVLPSVGTYYSELCCWDELMLNWESYGTIPLSIDYTTFQNQNVSLELLEAIGADVVISSFQLGQFAVSEIESIQDYVRQGHGFIASAGGMYYNAAEWGPFLGLTDDLEFSNMLINPLDLELANNSHPLFTGITSPYSNALGLTVYPIDIGWDSSIIVGASYLALDSSSPHLASLLTYRGLIHFSFVPEYTSNQEDRQLVYNSILWSEYVIPDHDLAVTLDAPSRSNPAEPTQLTATVRNLGLNDESDITLRLFINSVQVDSLFIPVLENGTSAYLEFDWTPSIEGVYNVTAYVEPVAGEYLYENNIAQKLVNIVYLRDYLMLEGSYHWYDAVANGINLYVSGDDVTTSVSLPFTFQYYDGLFDTIYVSSNGWLSFVNPYPYNFADVPYPTADPRYAYALAPFWDDLRAENNIYAWTTPDRVVIQYNNYHHLSGYEIGTFQVVFHSTGVIEFNYQEIVNELYCTVGLNYGDGIHYNSYTSSDLAGAIDFGLEFTWEIPEHDLACILNAPDIATIDVAVLLTARVINNGNSTEYNVHIALYVDSVLKAEDTIAELCSFGSYLISYMWTPDEGGVYDVIAIVDAVPDEVSLSNNIRQKSVLVEEQEEFIIISPTNGQTVSGSIVHIEYETDSPSNIEYILVYVNGEYITDVYYMGVQELMTPVFQNGTNIIMLEVNWYGGNESWASVQIQSIDVQPIVEPVPGDYFNWANDYGEYYESLNFTFGEMVSQFEVEVEAEFVIWYEGEIVNVYNTQLTVNILNGYVADDAMGGMIGGHLFFLSGLRSPSTTGAQAEIGDLMPMYSWGDIFHITSQAIWNGYSVWQSYSQDLGNYASVFRYNGVLATLHYYNGTGWVVDTSFFPPPDTNPPVWLSEPGDFTAEAGELFWYQFEVYDDNGLASFTVNNSLFSLTLSGLLTNTVPLHVGTYNLEVLARDPFGYELTGRISIFVEDHTRPEWLSTPGNLIIDFGDVLQVAVTASDFSGIDHYNVNSTRFTVTSQGVLMSIIQLQPGIYWLNITVYDIFGNMNTMVINVTVLGSGPPSDMFIILLVGTITVVAVGGFIAVLLIKRRAIERG